ncbi:MAG TPA: hypothetical protein VGO93_31600, partial [Candidatus Xenobia bacterium]
TLVLRLSAPDREAFIEQFKTRLHVAHGAVMKEYVEVPEAVFKDDAVVKEWFARSWEYVQTLKPKATTRPKK